jgi:hypothetical protein
LSELESKSWIKGDNYETTEKAVLLAKTLIMREMIAKDKQSFAEEYLKKCLVFFST